MNKDREREMMKLGAEVVKERLDKVEPLEEKIESLEDKLIAVLESFEVISSQNIKLADICGEMNDRFSDRIRQLDADVRVLQFTVR